VTPSKFFVYDSAAVNGAIMQNTRGGLAEAYTCTTCPGTKLTDIGFSYTNRGELSDAYESTPHSSGYYPPHAELLAARLSQCPQRSSGLPTITYGGIIGSTVGLDGEAALRRSPQAPARILSLEPRSIRTERHQQQP